MVNKLAIHPFSQYVFPFQQGLHTSLEGCMRREDSLSQSLGKVLKGALVSILLLLSPLTTFSQDSTEYRPLTRTGLDWPYFKSGFKDAGDIVTAPTRWNGKQWLGFGGVTITTLGFMVFDDEIQGMFQRNRSDLTNDISHYGLEPWGNYYAIGAVGGVYLHGLIWDNDKSKRVGLLVAKASILTAAFTRIPKYAFQRVRPSDTNNNPYIFEGPFSDYTNTSFFSGHTSFAFSIATIFASEYKGTWVPPVAYTMAALTGISRIHDNRHWASDVVMGAAFGYAVAKLVYNEDNWGIRVAPTGDGIGMVIPLR